MSYTKTKGLRIFKSDQTEKTLEQRVLESCCSFHIGLDDLSISDKPFRYAMTGSGVVKVVSNKIGLFAVHTDNVPGLPIINEGLVLALPKIPYKMLLQTISFFKEVMRKYNNAEAMVQFYYDDVKKEYILFCPDQEVSGARVSFKRSAEMDDTHTLVMDIHSHNTMGAFFSTIDNADEKENRIFGVIGKLNQQPPEMKFRISVGGEFKEIDMFEIFENPYAEVDFPSEWLNKCSPPTVKTTIYSGNKITKYRGRSGKVYDLNEYEDYYDRIYGLNEYKDCYDKTWGTSYLGGHYKNHADCVDLDVDMVDPASLVDLVKDILYKDAELVARAILEENLGDDIVDFLIKKSTQHYIHR